MIIWVGFGIFVDLCFGGGKLNEMMICDVVWVMEIDGEEYLFYKVFLINIGIICGIMVDLDGNVMMEKEVLMLEVQVIVMVICNLGGLVIVQVEWIVECGILNLCQVKIFGILVDCVVVVEKLEYYMQIFSE